MVVSVVFLGRTSIWPPQTEDYLTSIVPSEHFLHCSTAGECVDEANDVVTADLLMFVVTGSSAMLKVEKLNSSSKSSSKIKKIQKCNENQKIKFILLHTTISYFMVHNRAHILVAMILPRSQQQIKVFVHK